MAIPNFITSPSYDMLHTAALTMVKEARTLAWIDAVLAPVRGGLLFGTIASHKLNIPLYTAHYSSKSGAGDNKNHSNILPSIVAKTIFLVEDLVDSGNTMNEIVDHYEGQGIKVITAVFHYKESSIFHPDLYFWRIPNDSPFISYPYESN
jgi:hypoxanthine phosphoribosyltransferase